MNSQYKISKATVEDAAAINKLVNSAYRGDSSRKGWTTEADLLDGSRITEDLVIEIINSNHSVILKCEEPEKLLGCVELRKNNDRLYLGMLTVDPEQQGSGIGRKLVKAAEETAIEQGCNRVYMSVISIRHELIDWYKRLGFTDTGERKPFSMPDKRWGIPKKELEFIYLEKKLS
jgi:ribosomal protein S18 acetylase RimI-like enzyme